MIEIEALEISTLLWLDLALCGCVKSNSKYFYLVKDITGHCALCKLHNFKCQDCCLFKTRPKITCCKSSSRDEITYWQWYGSIETNDIKHYALMIFKALEERYMEIAKEIPTLNDLQQKYRIK